MNAREAAMMCNSSDYAVLKAITECRLLLPLQVELWGSQIGEIVQWCAPSPPGSSPGAELCACSLAFHTGLGRMYTNYIYV